MCSLSTKTKYGHTGMSAPKIKPVKNRGYLHTSSVSRDLNKKTHDNTSVTVKESRYTYGWKDNTKVLSKKEFIERLKNR